MTTMTASATITEPYNMKPHRRTSRIRLAASSDRKTHTRSKPIVTGSITMSNSEEPLERERGREFRSRRTHRKSRMGCMRCKQARRKCDEAKPRCSRCAARDADCQYPEPPSTGSQDEQVVGLHFQSDDDSWGPFHAFSIPSPPAPTSNAGTALSSATSSVPSPFQLSPIVPSADLDFSSGAGQALDARELELLSHYLTHTARAFAYDTDDLYALQIGFPSLAFRSGLIMKSILAMSAVCKCHDILTEYTVECTASSEVDADNVREMRELLALADGYHNESLSQTQAEITGASYCEFALANAPLMVLYGLASQSIRIQVTECHMAVGGQAEPLPEEFTPAHSQWISLIRAAHEAHTGMAVAIEQGVSSRPEDFPSASRMMFSPPLGSGSTPDASLVAYDGGSSRNSKQLLLPIISATCHSALELVRSKATALHLAVASKTGFVAHEVAAREQEQVQACLSALDILIDVASRGCGIGPPAATSPTQTAWASHPPEKVTLPSWLRDYLARVTNAAPSQASHRIITSFINRVPATFLRLTQDVIALVSAEAGSTGAFPDIEGISETQQLAMNIMAHWLVFMMLLDDIWWIGEIGGWELKKVATVMQRAGWVEGQGEQWWPESMYRIRAEVEKHR